MCEAARVSEGDGLRRAHLLAAGPARLSARPEQLNPLFAELQGLPGLGAKTGTLVARAVGGTRVLDLLWHLPASLLDRRLSASLAEASAGRVTVSVKTEAHRPNSAPGRPWRVLAMDAAGTVLTIAWFNTPGPKIQRLMPIGEARIVSGRLEFYQGQPQMTNPDLVLPPHDFAGGLTVEPVYRLTAGLQPAVLAKALGAALERLPALPEWLDPALLARQGWPDWPSAVRRLHRPETLGDLDPATPWRRRLAYDELLANQLALAFVRERQTRAGAVPLRGDGRLTDPLFARLPYALTGAQRRALAEITADMAGDRRMLRLLQGDVGSGKTIVALAAMLTAIEAGRQAALMAPTEILARQHLATIEPLLRGTGVRPELLTGRETGRVRTGALLRLAEGSARLAIGTHALFQEGVAFRDLGFVVVDEQHRFGVEQRLELAAKGKGVHVLVMTATPIPRTLTLTAYGDMEVSRLDEKPPGRQPVETRIVSDERLTDLLDGLERQLAQGVRAYWVCPLVEEGEEGGAAAARQRHALLQARFGARVGLVHGKMRGEDKDRTMQQFATGALSILVATTVIEVGVNVPEATLMIIEGAERFGLAQLHQLRGRVGRGSGRSVCVLLYHPPLSEVSRERLAILRETEDGFRIAEEDLRLRGAGDLLGTKQSGLPQFRAADPVAHAELLPMAQAEARLLVERDPELVEPRAKALRMLLFLWERDQAIRYLRSG